MNKIILTVTGKYKDGGSYSLRDSNGRAYWQDNSINSLNKGVIFEGDINTKNPKRARGNFLIDLSQWYQTVERINGSPVPIERYPRQIEMTQ